MENSFSDESGKSQVTEKLFPRKIQKFAPIIEKNEVTHAN